ncbi:MAG: carbohydrate binding domain-containing protein, partial [Cyclobacteriaceae bacterium]
AASAPTQDAADVISIFSDAYTDVANTNFDPYWSQPVDPIMTDVDLGGDAVKKWTPLSYQGIVLGTAQDVSGMTTLHLDVWSPDITSLDFALIGGGETLVTNVITTGEWNSLDIALTSFAAVNLTQVAEMKMVDNNGGGTIFLDNIYFYAQQVSADTPTAGPTAPTVAEADVISIFSDAYTDVANTNFDPYWSQPVDPIMTDVDLGGDAVKKWTPLSYQGIVLGTAQDVSGMTTLHLDVWSPDITSLDFALIGGGETLVTNVITTGEWNSLDIALTSFAAVNLTQVAEMKMVDNNGGGTIFLDNIYFYKKAPSLSLPITFDVAGVNHASKVVGNVNFTVIDNPEQSGINTSLTKVGRITNAGLNWENAYFKFDEPIDFSSEKRVTLKLYSTQALPIKLKFENLPADNVEKDANHGGTGWEELVFDFNSSSSFDNMVLFVDGPGTAAGTFYVDDIVQEMVPPTNNGSELIVDGGFETGPTQTAWETLTNNGTIEITDTDQSGGTYSAKLVANVPGSTPSNPIIQQQDFAIDAVSPGDVVRVDFYVKAIVTQPGADVKAALLSNKASGDGATRYDITFTPTGEWQFVTADITIDQLFVPANGLSIQFEAGCGGVTGCNIEMYVDNVSAIVLGNVDTTRPVITLTGGSTFNLATGTPYVDPGYAATDNIDGDITANVVVGGQTVDENTDGTYIVTYNVGDAEGNSAIQATRNVVVGGNGGSDVGPSLIPNGGFEDGLQQTDWVFLTNNGTIEITDVNKNGGIFSAKLVADVPSTGTPAASNPILTQEGFALNSVNPGDQVRVSFDVKALVTQPGADVKAALLSNKATGDGASRYDITFTPTGEWQTVTADITIDQLFVSENGLSIQFEAGCGGVNGCNIEMFVDNVSVSLI